MVNVKSAILKKKISFIFDDKLQGVPFIKDDKPIMKSSLRSFLNVRYAKSLWNPKGFIIFFESEISDFKEDLA